MEMTMQEAKEIYLKYDCSYFAMCSEDYSNYMEYRRAEVPQRKENEWKNRKIAAFYRELCITGNGDVFGKMYEIAADFWDYTHFKIVCSALEVMQKQKRIKERVKIAEIVVGGNYSVIKGGLIFWAGDLGKYDLANQLYKYACAIVCEISYMDTALEKRIMRMQRLLDKLSLVTCF